ncbi:MAG: OmpA family protein [Proteobacteria bacterium]|nr:OmpA family protein [Pseudomonadota bacterium]MBU1717215.1 OmpA family protein [Pseudomonadota bacterium]
MIKKRSLIEAAIASCPDDPVINYEYGYNFERFRKYEDALKYYSIAMRKDRKYAAPYFGVGDVQVLLGNYKAAIEAYEKGMQLEPGNERGKQSLAKARVNFGALTGQPVKTETATITSGKEVAAPAPDSYVEAPILRLQVPFTDKTSTLSQDAMDYLGVIVGQALARSDMQNSFYEIEGHTDDIGSSADNLELSKKRAETVRKYLIDNFKISPERLTAVGYGHTRPKLPNTSSQNQVANRRVEIRKIK